MKVLIIGDKYSQFITNFSIALSHFDSSVKIDIINTSSLRSDESDLDNRHYTNTYSFKSLTGFSSKIPKLRGFLTMRRIDKVIKTVNENIKEYNVVLLHGFWQLNCYIFSKLNLKNIFTVGAIWGSDYYKRVNDSPLFEIIDRCNLIIISTQQIVNDILKVKKINKEKIRNCLFGLAPLQKLFELQEVTSKKSKKLLGFEEDDFIIICGYNGSQNHQHLKILSVLMEIKVNLPVKTKLILPITYGGNKEYKKQVKEVLNETGIAYVVYEDFLKDDEIAHLRKATDLMIQIPITDALSGSLQEHLFAQNLVIAGSWLPYKSLEEKGIYFETIDDVNELKEKLIFMLKNLSEIKNKIFESNTPDKFKGSLWSECIKDWHSALDEYKY